MCGVVSFAVVVRPFVGGGGIRVVGRPVGFCVFKVFLLRCFLLVIVYCLLLVREEQSMKMVL